MPPMRVNARPGSSRDQAPLSTAAQPFSGIAIPTLYPRTTGLSGDVPRRGRKRIYETGDRTSLAYAFRGNANFNN